MVHSRSSSSPAAAIACAPVIYSWYLVYLTPFLLVRATLPLIVWSCTALMTYAVWEIARNGGRWIVPDVILIVEYGAVLASAAALAWRLRLAGRIPVSQPET